MSADTYPPDYAYKILEVDKSADLRAIKKSYQRLAAKYHPDRNPGNSQAEAKFKDLGKAWNVLKTDDKRAQYDQGTVDFEGNSHGTKLSNHKMRNFDDVFGEFDFGNQEKANTSNQATPPKNRRHRRADAKGQGLKSANNNATPDIHCKINVDFKEAALGATKHIKLSSGRTIKICLPEGTTDKQKLRVSGKGHNIAGKTGDLYLEVGVNSHPVFSRKGNDIYVEASIKLEDAILGKDIKIDTLRGSKTLTIAKGSNLNESFCLAKEGINGGSQYVNLQIILPDDIDAELLKWAENKKASRLEKGPL